MNLGAEILPIDLRDNINAAIIESQEAWRDFLRVNCEADGGALLAVKYIPSKRADTCRNGSPQLFIGNGNFTWGSGVYVTGVQEPLSTAIYGRVGVVSRFDPSGCTVFDARSPKNQQLYLKWLCAQPSYSDAVLTVHSEHWLRDIRNQFREQFKIDVVLFHPDEEDTSGIYTKPDHTWMVVSDWKRDHGRGDGEMRGRMLRNGGYSTRFVDVRMTILIEEEFMPDMPGFKRRPQLRLKSGAQLQPEMVRDAYDEKSLVRVAS